MSRNLLMNFIRLLRSLFAHGQVKICRKAEAGLAEVQLDDAPMHFLFLAPAITAGTGGFS